MPFAALLLAAQLTLIPDAGPRPAPASSWYGYQILVADAAVLTAAISTDQPELLLGLLVTGPVIHALHDKGKGEVAMSVLRRATLPIGGVIVGLATCDDGGDGDEEWGGSAFDCIGAGVAGLLVGTVVAEGWDLAVATEDLPTPIVSYDGEHAMFGFGGTF